VSSLGQNDQAQLLVALPLLHRGGLRPVRLGPVRLAGSWQTRKSSISVDIVVTEGKVRGTLVLLGPGKDRTAN
jgi:hypothetical protein